MTLASFDLNYWLKTHHGAIYLVLAFIIPLAIRAIPEILMGPYTVGFDTMGFYIPVSLLLLHHSINVTSFLMAGPLFYSILVSTIAGRASPVFTIKIISPLLLGFLGLSIFTYAKKGLGWSPAKSTFVALLGTLYFVALRASWDQLREELGLVFFFFVLTLLVVNVKGPSLKRYILLSITIMAAVLANQLVSVLMFGVIIATIVYELFHRHFPSSIKLILFSLPGMLYFAFFYVGGLQSDALGFAASQTTWTSFASYSSMLTSEGGFFFYCFLPLLPLIIVGLYGFRNLQLRVWLVFSLILSFLPFAFVSSYRWVLLLVYPFAFYVTDALSMLRSLKWRRYKFTIRRIAILYLVLSTAILSLGFIFMTPETPFFYFSSQVNSYVYQIPTSMLQNTISIKDCHDTVNALQWYKNNENSSTLLLTHQVFYGWALLFLNPDQVTLYGFDTPVNASMTAASEGYTQIYVIWWVNGKGWEGQPTLAPAFHEVYQSGEIAIYRYVPN